MSFDRIAVLGAGSWGSALANTIARAGREVMLWARDPAHAATIAHDRESPYLPGVRLEDGINVTSMLADAARADAILIVVPAQAVRSVATAFAPEIKAGTPLVVCAKGIERGSEKFMTEVIAESSPNAKPVILSGPSFASDVASGLPTAVTLAAQTDALASSLARALGSATFRLYHSTDIRGVEIGGAAKNVLAIAAGIVAGRGLGASATAALTTRGFAELLRFGRSFGARTETLTGLSGLGDLVLTCSTPHSRNFSLGIALGKGQTAEQALASTKLAEGFYTATALAAMARQRDIEMPIASAVAAVLEGGLSVDAAIDSLLTRPFRAED